MIISGSRMFGMKPQTKDNEQFGEWQPGIRAIITVCIDPVSLS